MAEPTSTEYIELKRSVELLELCIFVTRLDRPWEETDFVYQGFQINSLDELHALQALYTMFMCVPPNRHGSLARTDRQITKKPYRNASATLIKSLLMRKGCLFTDGRYSEYHPLKR